MFQAALKSTRDVCNFWHTANSAVVVYDTLPSCRCYLCVSFAICTQLLMLDTQPLDQFHPLLPCSLVRVAWPVGCPRTNQQSYAIFSAASWDMEAWLRLRAASCWLFLGGHASHTRTFLLQHRWLSVKPIPTPQQETSDEHPAPGCRADEPLTHIPRPNSTQFWIDWAGLCWRWN